MNRCLALLVLVATMFSRGAHAEHLRPPASAATVQAVTVPAPTAAPLTPQQIADAIATGVARGMPEGDPARATNWLLAIFTGLLVVFNGGLWWFTRKLWKETRDGRGVAETVARAAEDSARAALMSAEVSSAAERPRWVVTSMTFSITSRDAEGVHTCNSWVTLTNHGRTPAEITRTMFRWRLVLLLPEKAREPFGSAAPTEEFGEIVQPGASKTLSLDFTLTNDEKTALQQNATHLWVYGYIAYKDFLDEYWEKGFVGLLDPHKTNWEPHQPGLQPYGGRGPNAKFKQPPASARVQAYVYTRPDRVGGAEARSTPEPITGQREVF